MVNHYSTVILGASFLGVGSFLAAKGKVLLVEPSSSAGYEFIEAYHPGKDWVWDAAWGSQPLLKDLYADLEKKNLLHEGRVHLAGIGPLLFEQIKKAKNKSLFYTSIVSVVKNKGVFEIKLFNRSGYLTVTADSVLDTTHNFISRTDCKPIYKERSMQILLEAKEFLSEVNETKCAEYEIIRGRFSREAYLSLPLLKNETVTQGRQLLQSFWLEGKNELKSQYNLVSTAVRFREIPLLDSMPQESAWAWSPSVTQSNGLTAFHAGLEALKFQTNAVLA